VPRKEPWLPRFSASAPALLGTILNGNARCGEELAAQGPPPLRQTVWATNRERLSPGGPRVRQRCSLLVVVRRPWPPPPTTHHRALAAAFAHRCRSARFWADISAKLAAAGRPVGDQQSQAGRLLPSAPKVLPNAHRYGAE